MGIFRGRKNGMSVEFMIMLQWLAILLGAAFAYKPLGLLLAQMTGISRLFAFIFSYITCVIGVRILFAIFNRMTGGKLISTETFGTGEYYLGMVGGAVRFLCVVLVLLALLHAKLITPQQLAAEEKFQDQNFGSIRFPTLATTQQAVFKKSLFGRALHTYANFLLIEETLPEERQFKQKEFDVR
jgi:hypothetical protein